VVTNGSELLHNSCVSGLMTSPSPSDLCWVIGFTPKGRWIAPVVRAAVGFELDKAREIAAAQLGDERLASEVMELAIQQTAEYLADLSPIDIEETRSILSRLYRNEIRRRLRAAGKISYRGTAAELDYLSSSVDATYSAVEAELDLEKILSRTGVDLRAAMLLRYGARSQWSEVAKELGKSAEATRKVCEREMDRIRKNLALREGD
jgi:DNA-directed RNA polymerase specialized sigma24 family protein